jgi:hypothetical protein
MSVCCIDGALRVISEDKVMSSRSVCVRKYCPETDVDHRLLAVLLLGSIQESKDWLTLTCGLDATNRIVRLFCPISHRHHTTQVEYGTVAITTDHLLGGLHHFFALVGL